MCGIIGIVGQTPVNQQIFDGLTVLQHRGQDAAGMATEDNGHLTLRKHIGLVREVFRTRHMYNLTGNMGIGHVRYPTAGTSSPHESQPFYVNSPFGIAFAHNGNLINSIELKSQLFLQDQRHINTESDSEILLNVFAQELTKREGLAITPESAFDAVCRVYKRCKGAFTAVAMIIQHGIVAFRDPYGIRPLIYGVRNEDSKWPEYCIASESVVLDALGFKVIRDVKPGEVIYITKTGEIYTHQCIDEVKVHAPDLFEYVYLARPDSVLDEVYVHRSRMRMGKRLAKKIKIEWPEYKEMFDVIVPIPTTSRIIALEIAKRLKKSYREGFVKNRYIGRTFIMPGQHERKKNVRAKLNPIKFELKGKDVLLVDDSIVRGTTSREIIEMTRNAGARHVYFASASPPVRYPHVYGVDMPTANELIAHGKSVDEICKVIGADGLIYQNLEDLIYTIQRGNPELTEFDTSVFTGKYITGLPDRYLEDLEIRRNDKVKYKLLEMEEDVDDYEVA